MSEDARVDIDGDLAPARRDVVLAALRGASTAGLLVLVYALLPVGVFDTAPVVYFAAGAVLFGGALVWQLRAIVAARHPALRAVESIALLLSLFVLLFAAVYLLQSDADPGAFSEPLDKVSAAYFSVTVLSTTGFGDITATSDGARLAVTAQMIVDLVLLAVVVRVVADAVSRGRAARER